LAYQRREQVSERVITFLDALEAERHDLTYKRPEYRHQPQVIVTTRPDKERERKSYNAGRFAAGARDKVAIAADKWLQREMNK
jgi:hypothetical protein